ncbi:hypothetical protein NQD34_015643 [Periophthalmus magnuspinnatus]|nr:hypothetical protein NQD34_015643 [Periophthalmus magnuspinnatus]
MVIDLGSEQHTSKLRLQFTQARPHFTQLDAEANFITANFETVRRLQQRPGLSVTEKVTEEDVSALLDLHLCFKQKVEESESILELSNSLHLLHKQLAELFQSKPVTSGQTGCAEEKFNHLKEQKEQIHNFFNRASNLKMDICDGIRNSIIPGFRVEQLESHLRSLDTQRVVWLSEAAQCEEALLREMKTQALLKDIHQLRDSFKDLKKRFGNLKVNYLKRNDRSRNIKAARNQLQQVDMYEDKLQGLISRLQTLTARVHWEQKEGGEVRELEDLLNELHRQMGECERGVREHHKTLNMTCTLQEAMDEYQFWCEEASGTISRVGKFSSDCRSSEAVSALYRQFEKFVWPTVPQQEERISQITELATRLHGAEEGRRYIEKTLSKHSEMVTAIRKLSDGLLELEARLKLESLKQQQNDEEEVMKEDKHVESNEQDTEVNQEERKNREKFKCQEQVDNRTVNEAAEMYELKETGHTPELTNKHDGREIPVRRHSFNKKPPLQKNHTQETDRQATSSFCSTHMFSLSCSPLESNRQVYAIISPSQPAIPSQPSPRKTKIEEKDTAADSLLYTELLHPHPDALSEDSLSTDEYDCPSPDDISLPPLADTPESLLLPSDLEEGLCFSSQHSYRSHAQSEHRESSEANLHSVNRVRTESGTFFPSPVTTTIRSTTTEGSSVTLALGSSNIPAQTSRTTETIPSVHTHKDKNPSQDVTFTASAHVSKEIPNLHLDNSLPKSFPVCQSSIHQGIISLEATNLSDHVHRLEDFEKSQSDPILEDVAANIKMPKCEIPSVGIPSKNESTMISYSTPLHNEDLGHNPDSQYAKSSTNGQSTDSSKGSHDKNAAAVSLASLTTTNVNETVYSQSSMTSKSSVQGVISPTSEEIWFTKSSHHQNVTEDHKSSINCKDEQIHQNEKFKKAPHPESSDNNFASSTQESDSINHLNPSCNTTTNTKQNNHQTSTQQCVHDSGFSSQLAAPPLPEAKVKALPQQANMHVTPTFTSHQLLLTPDQDPDICQPCTIREEIRLTPQIKGPSVSPHDQDECSCSTKPVSKATVMGGSPVTLEVEVTGQPEPTLTWCKDDRGEEELDAIAGNQSCEEERVLDGALCEAWLTAGANQDKNSTDDDDDEGEDRGLMAEVYDIIMADWQTWFGTLCFLLWLLFLIIV